MVTKKRCRCISSMIIIFLTLLKSRKEFLAEAESILTKSCTKLRIFHNLHPRFAKQDLWDPDTIVNKVKKYVSGKADITFDVKYIHYTTADREKKWPRSNLEFFANPNRWMNNFLYFSDEDKYTKLPAGTYANVFISDFGNDENDKLLTNKYIPITQLCDSTLVINLGHKLDNYNREWGGQIFVANYSIVRKFIDKHENKLGKFCFLQSVDWLITKDFAYEIKNYGSKAEIVTFFKFSNYIDVTDLCYKLILKKCETVYFSDFHFIKLMEVMGKRNLQIPFFIITYQPLNSRYTYAGNNPFSLDQLVRKTPYSIMQKVYVIRNDFKMKSFKNVITDTIVDHIKSWYYIVVENVDRENQEFIKRNVKFFDLEFTHYNEKNELEIVKTLPNLKNQVIYSHLKKKMVKKNKNDTRNNFGDKLKSSFQILASILTIFLIICWTIYLYMFFKMENSLYDLSWRVQLDEILDEKEYYETKINNNDNHLEKKDNNNKLDNEHPKSKTINNTMITVTSCNNYKQIATTTTTTLLRNKESQLDFFQKMRILSSSIDNIWKNENLFYYHDNQVVKYVKVIDDNEEDVNFLTRQLLIEIYQLKQIDCNNLTKFFGIAMKCSADGTTGGDEFILLSEYCKKGRLRILIQNKKFITDTTLKYAIALDILNGLRYLHCRSAIGYHGELNSFNCVIDSRFCAKLTNFGFQSTFFPNNSNRNVLPPDDIRCLWKAPELLRDDNHNNNNNNTNNNSSCRSRFLNFYPFTVDMQKADIYSFGMILIEIFTGKLPFAEYNDSTENIVKRLLTKPAPNTESPPFRPRLTTVEDDDEFGSMVKRFINSCWYERPIWRSSATDLESSMRVHFKTLTFKKNVVSDLLSRMDKYSGNLEKAIDLKVQEYTDAKRKADQLLFEMIPQPIAERLKSATNKHQLIYDSFPDVSIMFSDIPAFNDLSASWEPIQIVNYFNKIFTTLDRLLDSFEVYKIQSISDIYLIVSGLPTPPTIQHHAVELTNFAFCLLEVGKTTLATRFRIGIHSGPIAAGIVGSEKVTYTLFGDTVNIASRIMTTGAVDRIHVSNDTALLLKNHQNTTNITSPLIELENRGSTFLKGKGNFTTHWASRKKTNSKARHSLKIFLDDGSQNHLLSTNTYGGGSRPASVASSYITPPISPNPKYNIKSLKLI